MVLVFCGHSAIMLLLCTHCLVILSAFHLQSLFSVFAVCLQSFFNAVQISCNLLLVAWSNCFVIVCNWYAAIAYSRLIFILLATRHYLVFILQPICSYCFDMAMWSFIVIAYCSCSWHSLHHLQASPLYSVQQ